VGKKLFLMLGLGSWLVIAGMFCGYYSLLLTRPAEFYHDRVSLFLLEMFVAHPATIGQLHNDPKSFDDGLIIRAEGFTDINLSARCAYNDNVYEFYEYEINSHSILQPHIKIGSKSPIYSEKKQMVMGVWHHSPEGGYLETLKRR
jgi:hypothetical protein